MVVITGASAGVGRATALEFAKHGAKIGLLARGLNRREAAKADIESKGGEALTIPTDVADATAVERAADQVERKFGPIDIWVNNAMTTEFSPVTEITPDETCLPRQPQPVPPIFEPEVAAQGIYWAAHHRRRELLIGGSTVTAVVGNKMAPSVIDRYLAHTGYEWQQSCEPIDPHRPDNPFEPAPGDWGADGIFKDRSSKHSPLLWATTHRVMVALASAGTAAAAYWLSHNLQRKRLWR